MIERLIDLFVQLGLTLLIIKLYTNMKSNTPKIERADWKDASETLEKLEKRLSHIQERDVSNQEKIWNLEDENMNLKVLISEYKRKLKPVE